MTHCVLLGRQHVLVFRSEDDRVSRVAGTFFYKDDVGVDHVALLGNADGRLDVVTGHHHRPEVGVLKKKEYRSLAF